MSREYVLEPFRPPVALRIDYERELNPQQRAAVTAPPGPALVLAGAGAGKTRTLIYRVAFLLEQGVRPERLLLLTFTNKAAREMMRRVAALLGRDLAELWGGTFHAIGHRILRRHAPLLGWQPDFTILDREDARDLMKACMAEAGLDTRSTRLPKPDVVCEILSLARNTRTSLAETVARYYEYFQAALPQLTELERRYQARKTATNVMDFDDLLVLWFKLLEDHPAVRELYQRRFQFILVDEYQDTNRIQADLIDLLAARHHHLMVVGDDAQSIYSWRGANFRNVLEFPKRHPGAAVFKIETNYRSTPEILAVANAAIRANAQQFAKHLAPVRPPGLKPVLVSCQDAGQQAAFVAQRLLELREAGGALARMAVLYRSHFHALELQLELTRRNIPFAITSGIRFFEQAHLKDLTAWLKLACNPADEVAFKRLVRLLPGIGPKAADKLWTHFQAGCRPPGAGPGPAAAAVAVDEAGPPKPAAPPPAPQLETRPSPRARHDRPPETPSPPPANSNPELPAGSVAAALQRCAPLVPKKAATAWTQMVLTFAQLADPNLRDRPDQMIRLVLEAGYEDFLKATYTNYRARREDLEELANFARQFATLEEFLTQLSLLSNLEAEEDRPAGADDERVRLSTIHQAKGLEFDVVFLIMLCEGLFPNARSLKTPEDEEEERRLFYVAITRARDQLYLTYPLLRTLGAARADLLQTPSRFLADIPRELLEEWSLVPGG